MKRNMMMLAILPWLLIGCVKPTPPVAIPVAPPKTESALLPFKKVDQGINEVIKENIKLEEKLKQQKQEMVNQKLTIAETIRQAEKIKNKIASDLAIKEIEMADIIDSLKQIETRNLFLETQNSELEAIRVAQEKTLSSTKEDALETFKRLIDKENEADALRAQNKYLGDNLNVKNNEVVKLQKALESEKVKSARAGVYRNWIIGLAIGFVVWTIVRNLLMLYFPLTKFRI